MAEGLGWLTIFLILGPLAWWIPPLLIKLNVSFSARIILSVVKFVKGMLFR